MKVISKSVRRTTQRRWAAGLTIVALLCARNASADVGATGLATVLCVPTACCGQIQFDDQTYSVFGTDYNIFQSGVSAVATGDTAIVLAEQGTFSGSWAQTPSGSFTFGASGSFLCPNPGEFCVGPPVSFVGELSNPTFPLVLAQHQWTFDGSLQYTDSPVGSVPPSCGIGFVYEGVVAFNAFLVGQSTPLGPAFITIPVSYFDSLVQTTFDHTVEVISTDVTQAGTTSATAFSSAPGQVLPGFAVRVGGKCSVAMTECASNDDCPSGEICFGSINGGYIDVSTDATYTPPIDVCITLDPDWLAVLAYYGLDLDDVRLAHEEGGTFRNRTVSRFDGNRICARVNSFSFFALGVTRCPETPLAGCRGAGKSKLLIKDSAADSSDKLSWKWLKGDETSQDDFADPTGNADYELCVYSGSPGTLIDQVVVAADESRWSALGARGFKYTDTQARGDGVFSAKLNGGEAGKSKVLLKAKGTEVPDLAPGTLPIPSADFPVRAQLVNTANGTCWESSYAEADAMKNDANQFNAKSVTP